jgi:hypothetical protein
LEERGRAAVIRALAIEERSIEEALALGPALLDRAQRGREPWIAASLVHGPAVVLGAAQRAGSVIDLSACSRAGASVVRRATTGTAAYVGGAALLFTLSLPHVASLLPDATARTLLNRNVRGFLRGMKRAGLVAQYFGREWIAVKHAPCAVLGFDVAEDGAVLIEVICGYDEPIAPPAALLSEAERQLDRWRGKTPVALSGQLSLANWSREALASAVLDAIADLAGARLEPAPCDWRPRTPAPILDPLDPVPSGLTLAPPRRVPIGWIEAAAGGASGEGGSRRAWIGGDVLAPRWVLEAIAGAAARGDDSLDFGQIAIEGAAISDLREAVRDALGN